VSSVDPESGVSPFVMIAVEHAAPIDPSAPAINTAQRACRALRDMASFGVLASSSHDARL